MRTLGAFLLVLAVPTVFLTQNFPQPGPGIPGFFSGDFYDSATACWSFNNPTDLGNDDCTNTYDLTAVNTPTATGGANSYSTYIDDTASQMVEIADNPSLSFVGDMGICGWADPGDWPTDYLASKAYNYGNPANWEWSLKGSVLTRTEFLMSDGTTSAYARLTGTPVGSRFFVCGWRDGSAVGSEINVSVNTVVGTPGALSGTNDTTGEFRLGAAAYSSRFQGPLGPVYYWSDNPSTAVMTSLYNSGKGKTCADLTTAEKVNMVSCWDMSEDGGPYADSIGSNTLTGVNTPTRANGLVERSDSGMGAHHLKGSSQKFQSGNANLNFGTSGFTVVGWWWPTDGWPTIAHDNSTTERSWMLNSDGKFYYFYDDSHYQSISCLTGSNSTTAWHFVAFWWDPSDKKGYCYYDTDSPTSGTALASPLQGVNTPIIIGQNGGSGTYSTASVDNVALFPTVLTSGQRSSLYNAGAGDFYAALNLYDFLSSPDAPRFAWSMMPVKRFYVGEHAR